MHSCVDNIQRDMQERRVEDPSLCDSILRVLFFLTKYPPIHTHNIVAFQAAVQHLAIRPVAAGVAACYAVPRPGSSS